jgi:hypothetical protein
MVIKSPLGAIGAVVVLVEAVAASALFAVESRFALQIALVAVIALVTLGFSAFVVWLIVYLVVVKKAPGLLFDPSSIDKSIHGDLYVWDKEKISAVIDGGDSTSHRTTGKR